MSFQMTGVTDILVGGSDPKTLHPDVGKMTLLFFLLHWKNWWDVLYQSALRNLFYSVLIQEHLLHWDMFNFPYKSTLSFSWWEGYAFVKCNTSSIRNYALTVIDIISFWKHTLQLCLKLQIGWRRFWKKMTLSLNLLPLWIRVTPLELLFPGLCLRSFLSTNTCVWNHYSIFSNIALSFQRISDLCKNAGAWLVVDNTYE
jgi:hypothetical protein